MKMDHCSLIIQQLPDLGQFIMIMFRYKE